MRRPILIKSVSKKRAYEPTFLFVLTTLSLIFILSYTDSCKQNKVYNKLCESQIRIAD